LAVPANRASGVTFSPSVLLRDKLHHAEASQSGLWAGMKSAAPLNQIISHHVSFAFGMYRHVNYEKR
jgi:hypothetical protein